MTDMSYAEATVPGACLRAGIAQDFNPLSPEQIQNPLPILSAARDQEPVFFSSQLNAWVVTRHDDIHAILKDGERFSSAIFPAPEFPPEVAAVASQTFFNPEGMVLSAVDPPHQTRQRAAVNKAFSARRVASHEPRIHQIANELIDRFAGRGSADLIEVFAYPFPLAVIFSMIGIPQADWARAQALCDNYFALFGQPLPPEQQLRHAQGLVEYQEFILALIEERRREPQDDFTSDLIQAVDAGQIDLSIKEIVQLLGVALPIAGHDTVINVLCAALYHLLCHGLWERVLADPELMRQAVEETLRHDGSVTALMRIAKQPITIRDVTIPAGAHVYLSVVSANHDERVFAQPECFDPARSNASNHFTLGRGIHYCLGAPLARLEVQVALSLLGQRLPNLRLGPEPCIEYSAVDPFVRSIKRLDLVWDAR
jgi:cytochrome P450